MAASIEELRETVERMEARLAGFDDDLARALLAAYRALAPVFAADLRDEHDELLSRAAALMLVQQVLLERGRGGSDLDAAL
jgi:hypothetical protein